AIITCDTHSSYSFIIMLSSAASFISFNPMRFFAIHPLHYTTTRSSTYTHSTPTLPLTLASYDDQLQNSNKIALIPYTRKILHHHHHHPHSVVVRQHQQHQYPRYFSSRIDFR